MRLQLLHISSLLTILLTITFKAWPGGAVPFSADYVLGFVFVAPLLGALALWALSGFVGAKQLAADRWSAAWAACLLLFVGWAWLSQSWAFMGGRRDAIAQNAVLTYALASAFSLLILCVPPPRRALARTLLLALTVSAVASVGQAALQRDLGWQLIGELANLDPQRAGVSVVQSGGVRLLRAYGLLPHPNILGGVLAAGAVWLLAHSADAVGRWLRISVLGATFLALCLTFSRGAWAALAVSSGVCALWLTTHQHRRHLLLPLGLLCAIGAAFALVYAPFITARTTLSAEALEQRSIAERALYQQIAVEAIQSAPLQGIGAGNFAWYAAHYLTRYPEYGLRGTNVHQVALLILSELGAVGFVLFGGIVTLPLMRGWQLMRRRPGDPQQLAALTGALALALTGFVDHYIASIPQMLTLWWALLALAMQPDAGSQASAGA